MLPFCITLSIPLCAGEGCWLASVVSHPVLNSLVRSVNVYQVVHKYDVCLILRTDLWVSSLRRFQCMMALACLAPCMVDHPSVA
ncbi:hypothetical protein EDD17DRAFT_1535223 [Pisolithus thermaeus]|nr:hypothetical protein EDD17DRAFT_1535223 [Pisolithus thermaeus]